MDNRQLDMDMIKLLQSRFKNVYTVADNELSASNRWFFYRRLHILVKSAFVQGSADELFHSQSKMSRAKTWVEAVFIKGSTPKFYPFWNESRKVIVPRNRKDAKLLYKSLYEMSPESRDSFMESVGRLLTAVNAHGSLKSFEYDDFLRNEPERPKKA